MRSARAIFALLALCLGGAFFVPAADAADSTTWLCKPGESDNPCAGTVDGKTLPPPGEGAKALGFKAAKKPDVDCFYVYPTQSNQAGPNANLDKDPLIRRAAIQQARQFSRVCRVYAPMYRQYTLNQLLHTSDEVRDIAYGDVVTAWNDYLANYNHGRGVILIGHSQGSSHLGRLIAERIDPNPKLRKRVVSAIIPGANAFVPKGKLVGGQFQHLAACSKIAQFGCVISYSTFDEPPPTLSIFGRTNFGYWTIPGGHPDPAKYDVMCVNPAMLDGSDGAMDPLIDSDYLAGTPAEESATPWWSIPDYYRASCENSGGASWLNVTKVNAPGETRFDLTSTSELGPNLHTLDVNLSLGNLVRVADIQSTAYMTSGDLDQGRKGLRVQSRLLKRARARCLKATRSGRTDRARKRLCHPVRELKKRVAISRADVKRDQRIIKLLKAGKVAGG